MALTPSRNLPLGTIAPDFTLQDAVSGTQRSLQDLKSEVATVVLFICNHCPFVKHIQKSLVDIARTYITEGVSFIAINSNDVTTHPDDSPEKMKETAIAFDYPFPYLFDETQDVAKAYQAACTPEIFIFDPALRCVYHGQFDDSRPGNGLPVTGADFKNALVNLLSGQPINPDQKPSIGCNIKWKA